MGGEELGRPSASAARMPGPSPTLARGRHRGLVPPVQWGCVSTGRAQPSCLDPVAGQGRPQGRGLLVDGALGIQAHWCGELSQGMGREGGGPKSLGVPAARGAAGSRPWQGAGWTVGGREPWPAGSWPWQQLIDLILNEMAC